jgi:hypothetical protein
MQLDPNAHLVAQLQHVSGTTLERLSAATLASVGYTVFRNLKFELGGQTAAEADVFTSVFTPLRESRILLECKGGDPSFVEIREFASIRHLVNTIGFRFRYVGQGSGIANYTTDPEDWTR